MFLDAFLASIGLAAVQSIVHDDKPDFVVALAYRRLGIEIREIVREPAIGMEPHREQESLRWQLVELVVEQWNERGLPPIHASVHFNPNHRLRTTQLCGMAETLLAVAEEWLPTGEGSRSIKGIDETPRRLPREVHTLRIGRFAVLERAHWVPADSGWIPSITPPQIQTLIDQKNRKRAGYRPCADEYWLLLCADGFSVAGSFELDAACHEHRFKSSFDRVGYFNRLRQTTEWLACDPVPPGERLTSPFRRRPPSGRA